MSEPIHGHEVMQMMVDSAQTYPRASLKAAMEARFGAEARFYTCSAQDLTAEALIEFLAQKGKFIDQETGFSTAQEKICNH